MGRANMFIYISLNVTIRAENDNRNKQVCSPKSTASCLSGRATEQHVSLHVSRPL